MTNESPEPQLMFDERLNQEFRQVADRAFLSVPELRSVIVVYDYYRNLNDLPDISKGLWLSSGGGRDKSADAVVGSLGALLQSTAHVLDTLFQQHQQLNTQLVRLSEQILEKRRELNQLSAD
jgi:hypothetical protein